MTKYIYPKKNSFTRMISLVTYIIAVILLLSAAYNANAQLTNIPVTGFNNDIIANGIGATNTISTGTIPGVSNPTIGVDGVGYTFVDNTYKWYPGTVSFPTCGMPATITSALTPGLIYSLQSSSSLNSMTIASNTYAGSVFPTSGTVTLSTPASYGKLYILYESVQNLAGPTLTATVTFTNASTQVISGNTFVNWFTNTGGNVAYSNMQRAQNVAPGAVSGCGAGPYLFEMQLPISPANYSLSVQSIGFSWSAATGSAANTVDYLHVLAVGGQVPCAGTPAPGNTVASSNPICSGINFTLSLQNPTGAGATYQWQSSPDNVTWANIAGATSATRTGTQTVATYYRCEVTCTAGPSTAISNPLLVTMSPVNTCYCTPSTTSGTTYYISNMLTTGGITNLNNTSAGSATGYQNFFATASMSVMQGNSVNFTMTIAGGSTYGKAIWIDFDQDGTFAAGEQVASSAAYASSPISGSFTVPLTATTGTTRMRVVATFTPNNPSNPCTNSGNGEYEDYAFNVVLLPPCTTPSAQPTLVSLAAVSTSQIDGSFSAAAGPPSGYLVVRYPGGSAATFPANGTIYTAGNALGLGTVIQASASTSFTNTGLSGGTAYDYYVYSYNNLCAGAPFYLTTGGFFGTQSTNSCSSMIGVVPVGPTAPAAPAGFPTLSGAGGALAYIVANGLGGNTILELQTDYTTAYAAANETYPLSFNLNACINSSKTLTIRPAGGVSSVITLTSAHTTLATVVLDGATYITFDGRNGGTGTNKYLSIVNTSTTAATSGNAILLKNDANNNTLTYLDVQSANGNAAANTAVVAAGSIPGAIAIGTAVAGANGNDNNTISFCDIHSTGTIILGAGIFAGNNTTAGTAANNDNNIITDNNIYDFYLATLASAGVDISLGNNNWTITNNHVYQQSTRNYGAGVQAVRGFWITPNTASLTSASGFTITGNYIGGNAANGSGLYTITGTANYVFRGMDISVGLGTATSIQNNTFTNWSVTGGFTGNSVYGIDVNAGNVNTGTVTGNLVGSTTTNGSITVTTTVTGGSMIGFRSGSTSGGTINFSNNTISGIDMIGSATTIATGFNGIAASGGVNITVNNNTIGSPTLTNSINMVSTSSNSTNAVAIRGIINNSTAASVVNTITNNLVANINSNNNATGAQASTLIGIIATTGTSTISGNTVRNLTSASQTTAGGATPVVLGIGYTSTATSSLISNNTIHTLKSTNTTAVSAIQTAGIWFSGPSSGTHTIEKNFIHSISIASVTNSAGFITGMDLGVISGATITVKNNMIRLGYDETGASIVSPCTVRGITKNVPNSNIWFNSIFIGGTGVGTSATPPPTFCMARTGTATDNWRNNILVNTRSNATTGSKHYQIYTINATTFTLNHNDYYGIGAGTVFAFNGTSDVASYSIGWVSGDLNSQTGDPQFINPIGTSSTVDLHIHPSNPTVIEQNGINVASVTDDFDGQSRSSNTPEDIGADAGNFTGFFCSGPPASATATLTVPAQVCGNVTKTVILSAFTPLPGYTYQWQESATGLAGSFVNVTTGTGATTSSFTTASLNSSMYYQCVIGCLYGAGTINSSSAFADILPAPVLVVTPASGTSVCSGANVDLSAAGSTGAVSYTWACNPAYPTVLTGTAAYSVVNTFITANNLPTVTSRPTSTLSNNAATPPGQLTTNNWEYKVIGTALNGCTSSSLIYLTPINNPVVPVQLTYTNSPSPVCAPGTPITFTVTNPGTIGAGTWTYNWYDQAGTTLLQSTTNTSSTDNYTPATPAANGNYIFTAKVTNSVCPASYAIASPTYFVGYTSLNVVTNANCGDNGIVKVYPEGQTNFSTWYFNNFNTGLLGPAFDASYGNTVFTGGLCNLTIQGASLNGALLIRNPAVINTNNLQVDFKLTTAPRGFAFNVLGADGMAWSYAPDVWQGQLTPGTGGFNAECGSGSGFKLAFDATANSGINFPGCYLMYNCTTPDQGPSSPGVIAFKQGSWWQGLVNAPVSIIITENGFVSVTVNNQVIFDHVALPAAYLTANKSNWLHAFTGRAGAANEVHGIDDLNIRYNTYEYSNNSTTGLDGTWQPSNTYSGLSAGSYPVWVRNPSNPSCFANTGTAVVGTSPSPSSAITVPVSGFNTTICAGSSTDLTTDVSIPGATFLWETASSVGGPYTPATGTNNAGTYSTGSLLANAYYRCTFTCPSSSPITSTPVLVTVNSGSIASTNSPQTINCLNDVATLTAVPGANTTCVWYAAATGGSPLFAGNSYAVTPVSLPATYYVEPVTTLFTNHYNEGGQKVIANSFGSVVGATSIATRFSTTASIRIDSIKVLPTASGTLTVALQNSGSATNILTFNQTITAAQVGSFINVPLSFAITGSGNYQLTTTGITCTYYNSYTGTYTAPYMFLGGVFSITGAATAPTSATSTSIYGTAFNWSITTSCPAGNGARVPVVVNSNPTYLVSVTPATTTGFCANAVQPLTASSPNAYNSYVWTPIINLYTDPAGTIPYTTGTNQATVYFKSATVGSNSYTVSTAGSGCTNTATASVSTISAPNVSVTATPNAVCPGGSIQLNATISPAGSYTYNWAANPTLSATNISNPVAQNIQSSQIYSVTVSAASGCTTTQTVNITVKPVPDVIASSNAPVCEGFPLSLFGTNNDGTQVNTGWSWSGPSFTSTSQNPNISNASAANSGTYTLTITNSFGCTATSSTDVIVNPNPVLSIGTQTNVSCNGLSDGSVDLDATSGTFPFLFDLTGPSTPDGIFTGLAAGTYTATVNDDNGCAATPLTVTITEPDALTVSAGSNTPVCSGTSLNLTSSPVGGTSGYSYAWTGPNGPVPAVQNPTIASATTADAGQYDVLITDAHGCTSTGSHTVQVNAAPTAAIALSGSPNKCLGQSATVQLTFTGTGPWNYTITGNGGPYTGSTSSNPASVNVTPIAGGVHTYTITAVGNASCPTGGTTSGSATVNVSTVPPPSSGPVPAGAAEACAGSVMLITSNVIAGQNIIYSWNTGSNSSTVLFSTNIGGPFTAGPFQTNTNQVYVQFGALAGGQSGYQVCLQGVNGCGSSINKCLWIRGVVSGPGAITPANQVVACPNDVKSYSCGTSAGASVYNWTLGGSATPITSGQGTQNVQVTFPPAFVSGQLCVTAALACGGSSTSPARCMSISKTPANANVPTGAATVCPGATGVSYSIPAVPGATGYNWTVPANATIATGTNSPSITVNFPTPYNGTSTVCVTTTSACGTSAVKCKNVASGIPNQPAGITGPLTNVCGSTVQYSVVNPIASSYTWTNPAGTTISGSATGSTILLNVSSTFTSGVLTVAANSTLCPPATSATRTSSTIWGRPNNPGAITANPSVWCSGGFVNFFVTPASPLPSYNWTVSNGTIDAGQGTSIIDVTWGATAAGTVSVNASNTCGQSAGTSSQSFSAGCREEGTSSATAFSVYPNPAHDRVTVSIDVKEQTGFNLKLRDMSGRVILSEDREGAAGINAYELDLKDFAKGIYMLEVQSADDKWKTKVIIE